MPDTEITWAEPPPDMRASKRTKWARVAIELRENPGKWAMLGIYGDASLVTAIKRGQRGFAPAGHFESASRMVDGKRRIFARYVGEAAS